MRRILLLPIMLGVSPLAAQLSPEQRHAQEVKAANAHLSEHLQQQWTDRALNGDPSAYGGQAALQERRELNQRLGFTSWATRVGGIGANGANGLWYSVGARPATLRSLHRDGGPQASVKAGRASILTVATPKRGPSRSLVIRASIGIEDQQATWSHAGPVTADQSGRYVVAVPAMDAGTYDLRIAVYDPDRPESPLSESQSTLVVKQ